MACSRSRNTGSNLGIPWCRGFFSCSSRNPFQAKSRALVCVFFCQYIQAECWYSSCRPPRRNLDRIPEWGLGFKKWAFLPCTSRKVHSCICYRQTPWLRSWLGIARRYHICSFQLWRKIMSVGDRLGIADESLGMACTHGSTAPGKFCTPIGIDCFICNLCIIGELSKICKYRLQAWEDDLENKYKTISSPQSSSALPIFFDIAGHAHKILGLMRSFPCTGWSKDNRIHSELHELFKVLRIIHSGRGISR